MIIGLDGTEKAGKTSLLEYISDGFANGYVEILKKNFRDRNDGLGYVRDFVSGLLDGSSPHLWDRTWISEFVYGNLLNQNRWFAIDSFAAEFLYHRALHGNGECLVMLPSDLEKNKLLRDEDDIDVDPFTEMVVFQGYANYWNYPIIYNEYTDKSREIAANRINKNILVGTDEINPKHYLGTRKPKAVFVGDFRQQFASTQLPFMHTGIIPYFRHLGKVAINEIGYATVEGFDAINNGAYLNVGFENIVKENVITVGRKAHHYFPIYPNVLIDEVEPTDEKVWQFRIGLGAALGSNLI